MLESLTILYPFVFYGLVICFAVGELIVPRRRQSVPVNRRWATNIGLFILGLTVYRICMPVSAIVVAEGATKTEFGVFQLMGGPGWVTILLGIVVMDLWKYVEHRLSHGISMLWRLHLVHHSDVEADFTTTERHHPLEAVVGIAGIIAVIYLFGIPPMAVAIYLLIATAIGLFAHANIRISQGVDRWLRWLIVTPLVHSVHHSAARQETDSNFGMALTVWDRIFGTYVATTPSQNAERIIGLEYFRDARSARLDQVLWLPFLPLTARRQSIRAEGGAPLAP